MSLFKRLFSCEPHIPDATPVIERVMGQPLATLRHEDRLLVCVIKDGVIIGSQNYEVEDNFSGMEVKEVD